jgi:hypothetical protein
MNERVRATLGELEQAQWFHAVGQQDTKAAIVLASWEAAVLSCTSAEWENLLLEAANRYRSQLLRFSKPRFVQWNEVVVSLKRYTEPFVQRKMHEAIHSFAVPGAIESAVQWDVLHVAAEAEFADVCPPGFYASQAYWYVKGHFPCGWQGAFPEGKVLLF